MTPAEVETAARNRYNAASDTFFSQAEIFELIFQAEMVLAKESNCIEGRDTSTSTVAGTQSYAYPTNFIAVRRVEYDGKKLTKIDMREDDLLTALSADTTIQGTPTHYFIWNSTIYLREIPDAVETLKIYGFKQPTVLATSPISTTLSVPARYHTVLIDYVTAHLAAKDKDFEGYRVYMERWDAAVESARQYERKRQRADAFAYVKDEAQIVNTDLGV